MRIFDFKKYRTVEFMEAAMINVLGGQLTRPNRMRAVCPRRECKVVEKPLLIWHPSWPVAYCHCCHQSIDALDIVRLARGTDYFSAAEFLEGTKAMS